MLLPYAYSISAMLCSYNVFLQSFEHYNICTWERNTVMIYNLDPCSLRICDSQFHSPNHMMWSPTCSYFYLTIMIIIASLNFAGNLIWGKFAAGSCLLVFADVAICYLWWFLEIYLFIISIFSNSEGITVDTNSFSYIFSNMF